MTRVREERSCMESPCGPPSGATERLATRNGCWSTENVLRTSSPRAAPTNHGAARAEVERTCWKPKLRTIMNANPRSNTRRTTGTSSHRSPERCTHREPRLNVREVRTRQHGDRFGVGDVDHVVRLRLRGVGNDWNTKRTSLAR